MAWLSIRLRSDAAHSDALCDLLAEAGALSVTLSDAGDTPVVEPDPGATPLWPVAEIDALFPLDADVAGLRGRLAANRMIRADTALDIRFVEDADWSQTWRNYTNSYRFGDRLWVVPRGADVAAEADVVLRLDPGLAFGTGGHPTTALCLGWLARQSIAGWSVVDFGSGSGILGIAALLLGAAQVTAVDHDPQALVATRANATYNGIAASRLTLVAPERMEARRHDLVLANILAGPLMSLAPQLTGLLRPGGRLVMSGLLLRQLDEVTARYPQFEFAPAEIDECWVMVEGTKTGG